MNPEKLAKILQRVGWVIGILVLFAALYQISAGKSGWLYNLEVAFTFWSLSISISYILELVTDLYKNENRGFKVTWLVKTLKIGGWTYVALTFGDVLAALVYQDPPSVWDRVVGLTIFHFIMLVVLQGLAKTMEGLDEIRDRLKSEE